MIVLFGLGMFLVFSFCFLRSPVSYGGALIALSTIGALLLSLGCSTWYGYLLFLVYVGGLLVLFLYIIMLSSNFNLQVSFKLMGLIFLAFLVSKLYNFSYPKNSLGVSLSECSEDFSLGLFLGLGGLLLLVFFAIVHIVFLKGQPVQVKND
uniref:NADH dehydrogenase subunit 6 n=1 Tax=Gastrocopta cristata TaxID=1128339 RepID=A0A0A6ZAB5_9EUPU|nr:NADH dehydrogenase subunit 6 [Gastrocopta cristata]AGC52851.1 NADH dehydrogenase subunit 6 [Gastrocopta cristata]